MDKMDLQARIEELEKALEASENNNRSLALETQRLQEENAKLRQSYDNLLEQIRQAKKKQFGASSEKLTKEELEEQLSLFFNEAEFVLAEEIKEQQVKAHTRKKKEFTLDKLPENIRVVGCFAHARRKFDEAVASLPTQEQASSAALEGQRYCMNCSRWSRNGRI